jgi:aldehyde:ferredoxin oxidoreductase
VFDALRERYGSKSEVGVSAIGPAGEQQSLIASVMNDRYHAFGRQGFGAVYGAKNLKAIVVHGSGEAADRDPTRFRAICQSVNQQYKSDLSWLTRFLVWMTKPKKYLGFVYRALARFGSRSRRRRRRCASSGPIAAPRARSRSRSRTATGP